MAYEITKNCEINNVKYNVWDIVEEKEVLFYPTLMKKTEKSEKSEKGSDKITKKLKAK